MSKKGASNKGIISFVILLSGLLSSYIDKIFINVDDYELLFKLIKRVSETLDSLNKSGFFNAILVLLLVTFWVIVYLVWIYKYQLVGWGIYKWIRSSKNR